MFTERLLRRTLLFEANHDRMVLKWPVDHTTRCDNLNRLACVSQIGQASWIIRDPPKRLVETIGDGPMSQSVEPWHSLTSFYMVLSQFLVLPFLSDRTVLWGTNGLRRRRRMVNGCKILRQLYIRQPEAGHSGPLGGQYIAIPSATLVTRPRCLALICLELHSTSWT